MPAPYGATPSAGYGEGGFDTFWLPQVTGLDALVALATRDDVDLILRSGVTVHWGSADQVEFKSRVLRALLKHKKDVYDVTAPELPTTFKAN